MAAEATTEGDAMTNETEKLIEEAEKITEHVPGDWTACKCNKCGLVWALGEMHIVTVELETEDSDVPQPSPEQRRRIMDFMARSRSMIPELAAALRRAETGRDAQAKEFARFKAVAALANSVVRWDSLLNEMHEQKARAQRAERERDAQAALVATLTAERDEARAGQDQLAAWLRDAMRKAAQYDETQAQVWGLICVATNCAIKADESYPALRQVLDQRDELAATRDLLTAENARLRAEVSTLELLQRGGK